jgi:GNAT superfamily N-acetyltransferase
VERSDVSIHDGPLSTREAQDAALVAARAFHTDPFFAFLSPKALPRARGLALYNHALLRSLPSTAKLLTARRDGRIVGVGAWVPPGAYPYALSVQLRQSLGALRALYRVPPSLVTGTRYLAAIDKAHPKEPLWYLQLLVCDPEHQRTGVGAALQEEVLARCDADGVGAYLETQKEDNLAYYRRFGYEVVTTLTPVRDGPPLWAMRREPRAAPAA